MILSKGLIPGHLMNRFLDYCNCVVILPLSTSVIYFTFRGLYHVYISKEKKHPPVLTIRSLINPGLYIGGVLGAVGITLGYPVLPKLLKLYKK